jgi:hypothetical protein
MWYGRGESSVHWDDWMNLIDRPLPTLGNDDSHAREQDNRDTYQGWNMVRVKERSAKAIIDALEHGSAYASTGPEIHDIQLKRVDDPGDDKQVVEATVRCSEARRIFAVCDTHGNQYVTDDTFEEATFTLRPNARWVRFEIIGPDGSKAWSNPFDLKKIGR